MTYAVRDCLIMLRRSLLHARRYPSLTLSAVMLPVVFLLLFVYVFGGTLGAGIGGGSGGRGAYLAYVTPGIVVLGLSSGSIGSAVAVNTDVTEGIVTRFRTMAITRSALLVGHVVGSTLLTTLGGMAVLLVAVLLGFRPAAGPLGWLALLGLSLLVASAMTWIAVALGLAARNPEGASNVVLPLQFLPFLATAFVPAASMPTGLRWFATYQPFTSFIETTRQLLAGEAPSGYGLAAVAWCVGLTAIGWLSARVGFGRPAVR